MEDFEQKAFDKIKIIVARNTLLAYPYFILKMDIHTHSHVSKIRLVTTPKGKPFNLFSRKLTIPKKRYTVMKKELLSTIETLKDLLTILLGTRSKLCCDKFYV